MSYTFSVTNCVTVWVFVSSTISVTVSVIYEVSVIVSVSYTISVTCWVKVWVFVSSTISVTVWVTKTVCVSVTVPVTTSSIVSVTVCVFVPSTYSVTVWITVFVTTSCSFVGISFLSPERTYLTGSKSKYVVWVSSNKADKFESKICAGAKPFWKAFSSIVASLLFNNCWTAEAPRASRASLFLEFISSIEVRSQLFSFV